VKYLAVFVCLILGLEATSANAQALRNAGFDSDLNYWLTYYENITNGSLTPGSASWDAKYGGSVRMQEDGSPGNIGMCQPTSSAIQVGDKLGLDVVFEASAYVTTFAFYLGDMIGNGQTAQLLEPAAGEYHLEITANKTYPQGTFCGFKITTWPGDATCWVKQATASILERESRTSPTALPSMVANPNPATGRVRVSFSAAYSGKVRLAVYDAAGRLVKEVADRHYNMGQHSVSWNRRDESGHPVSPGTYFIRLATEDGRKETASVVVTR